MNKRLLPFCLLFLSPVAQFTLAAQQLQKAKLVIIGVVHSENALRNSDRLFNLLKQADPDIILSETDTLSGFFTPDSVLIPPAKWYRFARKLGLGRKMPPEKEVLYKYKKFKSEIIIYPFDITINNRPAYVEKERQFETTFTNELNQADANKEIPSTFSKWHTDYIQYSNYLYQMSQQGYMEINRPAVSDSIRAMLKLEQLYFPALIDAVQRLHPYKEQYLQRQQYWQLRNETMARHIIQTVQQNPGKRIVILTGLLHKYYLFDLLQKEKKNTTFELAEFNDLEQTKF